jgi:uncharacterized protein YeaO (DUF488 family)
MNTVSLVRIYDGPLPAGGRGFLVERLGPRGVRREELGSASWVRDVAPSDALRRWFGHEPARWAEFRRPYIAGLDERPEAWRPLAALAVGDVTLVYSARDRARNSAVVLADYLSNAGRASVSVDRGDRRDRGDSSRRPR